MKINVWHSIEQRTTDASIDQCIHESKHVYVPKVDGHTWRKLARVDKQGNSIPREHLGTIIKRLSSLWTKLTVL